MSSRRHRAAASAIAALLPLGLLGCGASAPSVPSAPHAGNGEPGRAAAIRALERESRPIGRGPRFRSRARGPVLGPCRPRLDRRTQTHVEVFAQDRVVLLPAGIGVRGPIAVEAGRIAAARCYGRLATVDPTGTVLVVAGAHLTLAALFHSWGTSLSRTRLAGFRAPTGSHVRVDVDGRPRPGNPRAIALAPDAEIVLEVGPYVPPHRAYAFPPLPAGPDTTRSTTSTPATSSAARMSASSRMRRPEGPDA